PAWSAARSTRRNASRATVLCTAVSGSRGPGRLYEPNVTNRGSDHEDFDVVAAGIDRCHEESGAFPRIDRRGVALHGLTIGKRDLDRASRLPSRGHSLCARAIPSITAKLANEEERLEVSECTPPLFPALLRFHLKVGGPLVKVMQIPSEYPAIRVASHNLLSTHSTRGLWLAWPSHAQGHSGSSASSAW